MSTILDAIRDRVRSCASTSDGTAAPVAILWTDPQCQFAPAVEMLRQAMPELIELGKYAAELRRGPAIWVRCIVDRTLTAEGAGEKRPPIVYLPGVARQELRAGEECPEELRPLVELLHRGHAWVHPGGHDHTLSALLKSPAHLGLDVAEDAATNRALLNAVREVLAAPVASLKKKRLEAEDFDKMVSGDSVRDLLRWIGNADGTKAAMPAAKWHAFSNTMNAEYAFDVGVDGVLTAAERMCEGEGKWAEIWQRFEEAPDACPGLVDVLARVNPSGGLFAGQDVRRYLRANDAAEEELCASLGELQGMLRHEASAAVLALEEKHGVRRETVWAKLGRTRYANAMKPLAVLAKGALKPMGGVTPSDFEASYVAAGWQTDLALLDAAALIDGQKDEVVAEVIAQLASEWLDAGARAFQKALAQHPLPSASSAPTIKAQEGCCVLFVDGLRYDLGRLLEEQLEAAGCMVTMKSRWAALPTVTATAKPAVSPVASEMIGGVLDESFAPRFKKTEKRVEAAGLRAAITAQGGYVYEAGQFAALTEGAIGGWREDGEIDTLGHKLHGRLAREVRGEVRKVAETVQTLLKSGWSSVRVVTDHGWLLLPGGLPKVELSKHLVATKWARCAVLQGDAPPNVVPVPWHWNAQYMVATAPGVACFTVNNEYVHGGVSVQECLIPEILVTLGASVGAGAASPTLASIGWLKYRCVIATKHAGSAMRVDIRVGAPGGRSAIGSPRALDAQGVVSIPVDDEHEKNQLIVVLLDAAGTVVAQRKTRIGESA